MAISPENSESHSVCFQQYNEPKRLKSVLEKAHKSYHLVNQITYKQCNNWLDFRIW